MLIDNIVLYKELYKRGNYTIQTETPWGKHEKQEKALKLLNNNEVSFLGYGGSARCNTPDTLVLTKNGYVPIIDIEVGDIVLTYNEVNGKREYNKVLKKFCYCCAEPPKMIKFVNGITCTEEHKFLFKGQWLTTKMLRERAMEVFRKDLLCINKRKDSHIKPQRFREIKTNESSNRQVRIPKNGIFNRKETKDCKGSQASSSGFYTKSRKQTSGKSYRLQSFKQFTREFRMGNGFRERKTLSKSRSLQCIQERRKTTYKLSKKRRGQWKSFINRKGRNTNKAKVQTSKIHKANVSRGVWSKSLYNKRCDSKKKLESREIILEDFIGSKEIVYDGLIYDLHIENNHNYVISKDNIITHNSGKSWIASEWLTMQCLCYDGVGYGLARKELKNLKRTTLLTLFKVFIKYGLEKDKDYNYNQQESTITFSNGSQIFLIDTAYKPSDPLNTRFGGYELTGCVIDESNETNYDVIEILTGRCGFRLNDHYGISATTLETFNPDKAHVYNRYYAPHRDGKETKETKFIKALPSDNPDPQVATWLENQINTASEITIQRLVHGNFDYDESLDKLIESNAISDLFTNSFIEPTGKRYITADIARMGSDSTVIRVWDGLRVIDRIELNKTLITETADKVRQIANKYSVSMSRCIVDEDGVGGGVRDLLNCVGFVANSRPLGKTNYANLKAQCGFTIADLINKRKIYDPITNKTLLDKVRQELEWLREKDVDKDGKLTLVSKDEIKKAIRRSPDDSDTYIMRAYFEIGQKL